MYFSDKDIKLFDRMLYVGMALAPFGIWKICELAISLIRFVASHASFH